VKAIKNEKQLIGKSGLKDHDMIYLASNFNDQFETYYIKIFNGDIFENSTYYVFRPIPEDSFVLELVLNKDVTLLSLKEQIISNLKLDITPDRLRVRAIGKRFDPERIIKGDLTTIRKFNIDNPGKLMIETLPDAEHLKDNQIQLYLWNRKVENKSYVGKKSVIFEYLNNLASADQLYELCRHESGFNNISIAKYSKGFYEWEFIPEMSEEGSVNLRKGPYNIKDGDWIGIRNDSENVEGDDFSTFEDAEVILHYLKSIIIIGITRSEKKAN
jgi:hypothetical protein